MTNKEAIFKLIEYRRRLERDFEELDAESFDMAIKALEQQPCEDVISRQAAIDGLELQAKEMSHWSKRYTEQAKGVLTAINIIKDLPSVTPQQKIGQWIRFKNFENGYCHIKCSECGQYWSVDGHAKIFKHCFNCGAKMEVEKND